MEEISILTKDQVENLKVLNKCGREAEPTDFYVLQEGLMDKQKGDYWTQTTSPKSVYAVYLDGVIGIYNAQSHFGVRPVMPLSEIYKSKKNLNSKKINGIEEIEYGEFPSSVVDEKLEEELEKLYQNNKLKPTDKKYTSAFYYIKGAYQEYLYKNNKYVRVSEVSIYHSSEFKNGRCGRSGETYWVKVEPIKWIIDEKEDLAISKYILTSMVFKDDNKYLCYENSDVKEYLEKYFIKEIQIDKGKNKYVNVDINKINDLIDMMNVLNIKKPKQKVRKNNGKNNNT